MAMRMVRLLGDTLYRMSPDEPPRLIWERPEPDERRASTPLARAQVVTAAVRLADAEGLAAVSIRHVAAALGVRPMRLYSHVSGKGDLLELMIDAVTPRSATRLASMTPAGRCQLRTSRGDPRYAPSRMPPGTPSVAIGGRSTCWAGGRIWDRTHWSWARRPRRRWPARPAATIPRP